MPALSSARSEVDVANLGVQLARQQVEQSRDRFQAGVTNNVEVIQAPAFKSADEKKPDLAAATKAIIERTNDFRAKEGRFGTRARQLRLKTGHLTSQAAPVSSTTIRFKLGNIS